MGGEDRNIASNPSEGRRRKGMKLLHRFLFPSLSSCRQVRTKKGGRNRNDETVTQQTGSKEGGEKKMNVDLASSSTSLVLSCKSGKKIRESRKKKERRRKGKNGCPLRDCSPAYPRTKTVPPWKKEKLERDYHKRREREKIGVHHHSQSAQTQGKRKEKLKERSFAESIEK